MNTTNEFQSTGLPKATQKLPIVFNATLTALGYHI